MIRRPAPRGFTLLEIVIALAIFAIVSVAVYTRVGEVLVQTRGLEARTLATWVAQNSLARLQLEQRATDAQPPALGRRVESVHMAGRDWQVAIELSRTSDPELLRVDIAVAEGRDANVERERVAGVTSFLGRSP